ncbi:translation initiation factor 2 [Tardiphaga sp. 215_C5_N2_1]|uniref:translation initiation factor 2 n=1 Tax=Tardiphaga sp. 215_C5_N2_1 TaxID=3240774 RepID=UPI003F8C7DE4
MYRMVIAAMLAPLVVGCATVVRDTSETINVITDPPGATARAGGTGSLATCITPCALSVRRNDDVTIIVSKDGYETEAKRLSFASSVAGAASVGGNVIAGGIVGIGVDTYNLAGYHHEPNPVHLTLQRARGR